MSPAERRDAKLLGSSFPAWAFACLLLLGNAAQAEFIRNGQFENSNLDGWTLFTATDPPASSLVPFGFVSMDVGGRGFNSVAPAFIAGRGGGGLLQLLQLNPGTLGVSVDVATNYEPTTGSNGVAGIFTLYFNGVAVATKDFGSINGGETKRARLSFSTTVKNAGVHELRIGISRPGVAAGGPTLFIDNVTLTGSAAVRTVMLPGAHLFVADASGAIIRVHPKTGAQKLIASGGLMAGSSSPNGIAIAGGLAYVTNFFGSTLVQVDLETGAQAAAWVGRPLFCPTQLAWEAHGSLLITNSCGSNLSRFDPLALATSTLNTPGSLFIDPFGLVALPTGKILVSDGINRSITRIDANGANPVVISAGGAFRRPQAMTSDGTGKVWVADKDANSIIHVDAVTGRQTVYPLTASAATGIAGIAVMGGNAFVSNPGDRQVLAYQFASRTQRVLAQGGTLSGPLRAPTQIAVAPDIVLADFSDMSLFALNGDARQNGAVLRLTNDGMGLGGSAFHAKPFLVEGDASFTTRFVFRAGGINGSGPQGSDGLAFVIHADPRGAAALGNAGEGLGFGVNNTAGNLTDPIAPSVAVEFDTHQNAFDPDGNHVALIVDGKIAQHAAVASLPCPSSVPGSPGCLNSGAPVYVWVDYGVTAAQRLEVFVNSRATKPPAALLVRDGLNLASLGDKLYFGFTAATGIGTNVHEVLSWALSAPLAPGDLNGDNAVTCADLGIVKRALGKRSGDAGFDPLADTQGDGIVDVRDVAFISQKLPGGSPCP